MSHFIMSSKPTFIFGTPNGHDRTQLLQAIHRGLRAVCTTPSPVRLMASAGHTSAQVGVAQWTRPTGSDSSDGAPVSNSESLSEWALWASHSLHAAKRHWQPMH